MLEFRNGKFDDAERYFRNAMKRLISRNDNPYDTEVFYNLGLVLKMTGRYEEAYKYFYKAVWHYNWRSAGYYALAEISARKGDLATAFLGKDNEACKVFFKIIEEGDRLIKNCDKYGYFGVGLPIPQTFEGDIRKLNTVAGALLKGIGYRGLGNGIEEKKAFGIVKELDPYNFKLHIFDNIVKQY